MAARERLDALSNGYDNQHGHSLGLTGEQIRAARAFLRIDQKTLAVEAGVSLETIKRLEKIRGSIEANSRTLNGIHNAFLRHGVIFNDHERPDIIFRRVSPLEG